MGLETGTYVPDLVITNPVGATDAKSEGDNHIRLIKSVLKASFPDANAPFYINPGIITTSKPMASSQTWNDAAVTFKARTITITDTASAAGSLFVDYLVGASSKFSVSKAGAVTAAGLITASAGATIASGQTLTLTGATVAGAPTWSSSQAITLSTAAQPNVTSLGTLTVLAAANSASLVPIISARYDASNPSIGLLVGNASGYPMLAWNTLPTAASDNQKFQVGGGNYAARFKFDTGAGTLTYSSTATGGTNAGDAITWADMFTVTKTGAFSLGSNSLTAGAITATTGTFIKAAAGASIAWTNGAGSPKTGYLYSDANYIGIGDTTNLTGNYVYITPGSNTISFQVANTIVGAVSSTGLSVTGSITATAGVSIPSNTAILTFPPSGSAAKIGQIYRLANSEVLHIDTSGVGDRLTINLDTGAVTIPGTLGVSGQVTVDSGIINILEASGAPTGSSNYARLFAVDNGAGKTVLKVIFSSGAAAQIAIEP